MRVQRVLMPGSGAESWTVLGDDYGPVEPVERYLAVGRTLCRQMLVQGWPLVKNTVGAGFWPLLAPWNPKLAVPPLAAIGPEPVMVTF
jgi:hypothetical protein